ncbi:hypothetical protein BU16DRAFT_543794 [Lophium mytilinum]|uniref:Uncharacterized protein n=1 Tax=Lophium mytilinum TaxID=390894 RepID=A0A6A6QDK1_9PEZI|nr:hypothetical protein BU16DRAFT_543794 [Lophium mytilinum]
MNNSGARVTTDEDKDMEYAGIKRNRQPVATLPSSLRIPVSRRLPACPLLAASSPGGSPKEGGFGWALALLDSPSPWPPFLFFPARRLSLLQVPKSGHLPSIPGGLLHDRDAQLGVDLAADPLNIRGSLVFHPWHARWLAGSREARIYDHPTVHDCEASPRRSRRPWSIVSKTRDASQVSLGLTSRLQL